MIVTIITPDSAGSKGDEAMVRGALHVFRGSWFRLLTTERQDRSWKAELLDLCGSFDEIVVPFNDLAAGVIPNSILVVLGADIIDGTSGIDASLSRLRAIRKCASGGGKAMVFMSFRSDVNSRIKGFIKEVSQTGNVEWFCRDSQSASNFQSQIGIECRVFPDFAYYCSPANIAYSSNIISTIKRAKASGKTIVGVNFCHHSFSSFHTYSEMNIADYTGTVINYIQQVFDNSFFVMIPHDTRKWPKSWTDAEFAEFSRRFFGDEGIVLPAEISYVEILNIVPQLDLIVTGRMHLAITSFRSGVIPVMYTGKGENTGYRMVDKCRGMFGDRIGTDMLVATDRGSLLSALELVHNERSRLTDVLRERNSKNTAEESEKEEWIRSMLGITGEGETDIIPDIRIQMDALKEAFQAEIDSLKNTNTLSRIKKTLRRLLLRWNLISR